MSGSTPSHADALRSVESAEAGLGRLHHDLEGLQRLAAIGTLSAGVVHEVRNLLTPALTYASLLRSRPEMDEVSRDQALEKVVNGIRQAVEVSNAMLGLANGDRSQDIAEVESVVQAVLDCLGRNQPTAARIETAILPGTLVRIGRLELQQVLLNLVLNAVRAMNRRSGTIAIRAAAQPDGNTRIVVADDGPGIPESIRDRLFEPFVTSGGTTPGTGLGLAICRQIVLRHNGSISVDTSCGQGTSFTIFLPTAKPQRAEAS